MPVQACKRVSESAAALRALQKKRLNAQRIQEQEGGYEMAVAEVCVCVDPGREGGYSAGRWVIAPPPPEGGVGWGGGRARPAPVGSTGVLQHR